MRVEKDIKYNKPKLFFEMRKQAIRSILLFILTFLGLGALGGLKETLLITDC